MNTIARGIKTPIIRKGDNLAQIVADSILKDASINNYELNDRDIIGITESVVSISIGNFVDIKDVVTDLNNKFEGDDIGIVFPILSRNRFSIILKAIARAKKDITIMLSYPNDEVGNPVLDLKVLKDINSNFDLISEEDYLKNFSNFKHPWTNVNIVEYYRNICLDEKSSVKFVFSNNPEDILKYTKNVLVSDIHTRFETKEKIRNKDKFSKVYGLDDISTESINESGFNKKYGLLGSNLATKDSLKLFPNENYELLENIQNIIYEQTNKKLEILIYGDGAFKDPVSKIWELADPVVSPFYTKGLIGSPVEFKLKYLSENEFKNLSKDELEKAIESLRKDKKNNTLSQDSMLGTTPRRYVDLIGSLCDLVSGSGDKGTPVVLIQNYF
ncbi:coenzyme F420-0:L-glutamate ligase [Haploplasma modicum]|uniref:coenzyme F420-0:L-glutamate ligase n=1 Tax=Haploplasma modicum TaxID=2150 RepID=UPI00214AF119|nr:coenzyme F420-0:L-glutamate ligase [Haploplasma modicum]MCR1809082.1 coenzyme F420-0:L-glutamate ligase [Haploplasma modicum]